MLSDDNDQEYEEELVDDVEDPLPLSSSRGSNSSASGAALGASSVQQSSVSRGTALPQYNSQIRSSSMQETAPLSQSELIARSMQQNRPPSQFTSSGRQASTTRSSAGQATAAGGSTTRPMQQNVSSSQYMASRQASAGSVGGQPTPQYMASRQASVGSAGQPLGVAAEMSNRSPQVASSRSAYAPQPKDGADSGTSNMRHWVIVFGLLILICLAVAAIVVPLYVKPQYTVSADPKSGTDTPAPTPATASLSPSAESVPGQSLQPTTEDFANFVKDFALQVSGSAVLEDSTSPQYKAVEFIANDANYTSTITDDAMIGDFYAVAVFYYSTGGEYWLECSQDSDKCPDGVSWMTYNVTYCDWNWITCNEAGRVKDIIFSKCDE
jgi:hypothetical protein